MAHHSWVGQTLGDRYKIQDILGRGGLSSVYKATDPNLRRVVAIKMIHPHLSDNPEFVGRFQEEAAAVAQLRHPNIAQVFDFNNDGDTYYMVLEFVPGETLQARLKRLSDVNQLLSVPEAVQLAAQICDAAEYAHQRGMIHRDIKPANVMLDVHGQAILMDFGIAKIIGGQHHTATGATVGTALYMSPEQIRGVQVDGRSDIYSIGVNLFEMLRGRPPFEADSVMTVMMMHLDDPVPDLRQLRPQALDELVAVIEQALAKDRKERFRSAKEMALALREVLKHLQIPKSEPEPLAATLAETTPPGVMTLEATRAEDHAAMYTEAVRGQSGEAGSFVSAPPVWRRLSPALVAAGAAGLILLVIAVFVVVSLLSGDSESTASTQAQDATGTAKTLAVAQPSGPFVRIEQITVTQGRSFPEGPLSNLYAVDYETIGFVESEQGFHIHFFFNTVPLEHAGVPGVGPWVVHYGPSPFTKYALNDRPDGATQMCARVANADSELHLSSSGTLDTGNCVDLSIESAMPTVIPASPGVRITDINVAMGDVYVVDYEAIGFTESPDRLHIHFFFNTVPPEHAGVPAVGPWVDYYDPSPFAMYTLNDRPAGATKMCALVANADHTLHSAPRVPRNPIIVWIYREPGCVLDTVCAGLRPQH
jgi:hypothetical protein